MITYWFFSMICYFIDLFTLDKDHKNWKKYKNAAVVSFVNQTLISVPTVYLLNDHVNNAINKSQNDTITTTLSKVFIIANLSNIFFYFLHYLLHLNPLYKLIHYKHHEFIDPIAVAALYAHPIEHLFGNLLSFIVPFILIGTNYYAALFMVFFGTLVTITAHCDYKFLGNNKHPIHHRKFLCN